MHQGQYYFLKKASVCEKVASRKCSYDDVGAVIAMATIVFQNQLSNILHLYCEQSCRTGLQVWIYLHFIKRKIEHRIYLFFQSCDKLVRKGGNGSKIVFPVWPF